MLVVLLSQTLTPVVTVFAEDTTSTQASSEVQTLNESTSQVQVGQGGTTVSSMVPVVPDSTPPSTTASSEVIASSEVTNESPTSESQEVATTEEAAEEDEEPAQGSTGEVKDFVNKNVGEKSNINIIDSATLTEMVLKVNDVDIKIENGKEYDIDLFHVDGFILDFKFNVTEDSLESENLEVGTVYEFVLPLVLSIDAGDKKTDLLDESGTIIGEYTVKDGKVQIIFNDTFVNRTNRQFNLNLQGALNADIFDEDRHQNLNIPFGNNKEFDIKFHAKSEELEGKDYKKMNAYVFENGIKVETTHRASHADWVIRVNDEMNRYQSATIKDNLSVGHKIDTKSFEVYRINRKPDKEGTKISEEKVNLTSEQLTSIQENGFELTLSPLEDTYEIRYTTLIEEQELGKEDTTISNNAVIQLGDKEEVVVSDNKVITWGENKPSITKESVKQNGKYAEWKVQYNYGNLDLGTPTILTDTVNIGGFEKPDLNMIIKEVIVNAQGTPQEGRTLGTNEYTVIVDTDGKLVVEIPNSQNKGYLLTYQSILPGGLNNQTETNAVEDSHQNKASAELEVSTEPGITKTGAVKYENGKAYIDWTVIFNSDGYSFDHPFTLIDKFDKTLLSLDTGSVKINNKSLKSTEKLDALLDEGFKLTIDPVEPKEYKLTYRTEVTEAGLKAEKITNEARLSWNEDGSGGVGTDPGYEISGIKPGVSKGGEYRYDQVKKKQYIEWTIIFNKNKLVLEKGTVLEDVFSDSSLEMIGTPVVTKTGKPTQVTDYSYSKTDAPTKGFKLTFGNGTAAEIYTVKYKTTLPVGEDGKETNTSVKNTVKLDWQGITDTAEKEMTPRQPGVTKVGSVEFDTEGKKWNKWIVSFNTKEHIIRNLVVTDVFKPASAELKSEPELYQGGKVTGSELKDATKISLKDTVNYSLAENTDNKTMTFEFKDDTKAEVYQLVYYTSSTPEDEKFDAQNEVQLSGVGVIPNDNKVKSEIKKPTLSIEKQSTGIDTKKDPRRIVWEIRANTGKESADKTKNEFVQLVDAYLEDTIPLDQRLVKESIVLTNEKTGEETKYEKLNDKNEYDDNRFKIHLPDGPNSYKVTYETEILQYPSAGHTLNPDKLKDLYVNEVKIVDTHQGEQTTDASAKYFKEGGNTPKKQGEYDQKSDSISWTVEVNQAGLPLLKTTEHDAQIIDELDNQQTYVKESILVEVKNGDEYIPVPDSAYQKDITTNEDNKDQKAKMIITFNDRTAPLAEKQGNITHTYRVTYKTILKSFVFGNKTVTNKIALSTNGELTGGSVDGGGSSQAVAKWHFGGGGSGQNVELTATKVDSEDSDKKLSGVKFDLYLLKLDGTETLLKKDQTTADLGDLILKELWYGRFVLRETAARTGYELDKEPIYFGLEGKQGGGLNLKLLDKTGRDKEYPNVKIVDGKLQIQNTRTKKDITAKKVWTGESLPKSKPTIWFTLYRHVGDVGKAEKVGTRILENGTTEVKWHVPTYDDEGKPYTYFVKETDAEGVDSVPLYYSKNENGLEVINTFRQEYTSFTATKIWNDFHNIHQTRPESIYLELRQDGNFYSSVKISGTTGSNSLDTWEHIFADLPVVNPETGTKHVYSVIEVDEKNNEVTRIPGKESSEYDVVKKDKSTIANELVNITEVSGKKIWNDEGNRDGKRPKSIKVQLLADGQPIRSQELKVANFIDGSNEWNYSFKELKKYNNDGKLIEYSVREEVDEDTKKMYETKISGTNIINTHIPEVLDIPVTKIWDDENNLAGFRPESITVILKADNKIVRTETITATAATSETDWEYTFTDLPRYKEGKVGQEIKYTIEEKAVENYTSSINQENFTITNTHEVERINLTVDKTWEDTSNQDGKRPKSITVRLLANGHTIDEVQIKGGMENSWSYEFTNLPKFNSGNLINYTVEEDAVAGYETEANGLSLTNTHQLEKTSVSVKKVWNDEDDLAGFRPESIKVKLLADGQEIKTQELSDSNIWEHEFTNLPKYKEGKVGQEVKYTIEEVAVANYESSIVPKEEDPHSFTITNSHKVERINLSGKKIWDDANNQDGVRPSEITIYLLANGETTGEKVVTGGSKDTWSYNFENLPKYKNGQEITYTVSEATVPGYETTFDGMNVTNTYTPELTSVNVTKSWSDQEDRYEVRPESITVKLLANGKPTDKKLILTEKENWMGSFTGLPLNKAGKKIIYTIEEETIVGYQKEIDQTTGKITNTMQTINVSGEKVWIDKDNAGNQRPTSIVVNLLQNGTRIATQEVKANEAGQWNFKFTNLPIFDVKGEKFEYTVTENGVDKYNQAIEGNAKKGFTVTNTRKTYAIGDYTWIDADKDGIQDEEEEILSGVIVELFDETGKIKIGETTTDENGRYIFDELEDGKYTIKFTLTEEQSKKYEFTKQDSGENDKVDSDADELTGWTTKVTLDDKNKELTKDYKDQKFKATEGIDPTWDAGVIVRERIEITGTKVWVGGPKAKPTIELQLFRNGEAFGEPVKLKDGTTTYTWKDLYKTDTNKNPYVYTVQEVGTPSEYNKVEKDLTVTNTRKTYAIGDYTWIDTDKDGIQDKNEPVLPGVKVELFDENGKKIAETTTDKNGRYIFDELESGKYKVKFTLTDEQKKLYKFTKRHSGDAAKDSNADDEGWTIDIDLNEKNAALTKDYQDQAFKASEGVDPTWDAGVILLDVPVKPTNPKDPKPNLPQMGEDGNPIFLTSLGILLIGSVAGIVTTRRRRRS